MEVKRFIIPYSCKRNDKPKTYNLYQKTKCHTEIKTYVAFDADSDIRYYRLMKAWKQSDNSEFNFFDAHDLTNIWQYSSEETIKRNLRERLMNTKIFVLLVGEKTKYLYKYVKWEIEQAAKPRFAYNSCKSKWK